jgi:mRNA-degrading endonuclease toxin of MazEF toxin-antitoxin module
MGRFYHGLIAQVWVMNGKGETKERPAVIIERDENCQAGGPYLAIAITKSIEDPMPDYHFVVHDGHYKHPITGLIYPCVAKCNWAREIEERRVISSLGTMPDDLLEKICQAYDRLCDDDEFDDWQ